MSAADFHAQRLGAQSAIAGRIGEYAGKADQAKLPHTDEAQKRRAQARIGIEMAVIRTAMEVKMPTQGVATQLANASPAVQAKLIKDGYDHIQKTYDVQPELLVGALAGKVSKLEVGKGMQFTKEMDAVIDEARKDVANLIEGRYANRGKFQADGDRADILELKSAQGSPRAVELATKLAYIDSAIDGSVSRGDMSAGQAQMFKERLESQVFQARPPESLKYSDQFRNFYAREGESLRGEIMKSVREVTQSHTVQAVQQKVNAYMGPSQKPQDKPVQEMER